jgi:hypothetical protein
MRNRKEKHMTCRVFKTSAALMRILDASAASSLPNGYLTPCLDNPDAAPIERGRDRPAGRISNVCVQHSAK